MTGELGRGCQSTAGVIHHTVSSNYSVVSIIVDSLWVHLLECSMAHELLV